MRLLLLATFLLVGSLSGTPLISEFLASNDSTLLDGNGNSSDWIEIYNPGPGNIDLAGYRLTDDPGNSSKWIFPPSTPLEAGSYLIVFASGDNTPDPSGNLHTNFRLSAGGEYLALHDPAGSLLSEYETGGSDFPPQQTDVSYGLIYEPATEEADNTIIGNGFSGGNATQSNGSFEDTNPSSNPSGSGGRWAANGFGQVASVEGWTSTWEDGFVGFDDDTPAAHGDNYAFVNNGSEAVFRSADVPVDLNVGETLTLKLDTTNNVSGGTSFYSIRLEFGSGPDAVFSQDLVLSAPTPNAYSTQTFQHQVEAGQAGNTTVAVIIHLKNPSGGDQPKFDNVRLTQTTAPTIRVVEEGDSTPYLVPLNDSVDDTWTTPAFDDSSWSVGNTPMGYENSPNSSISYDEILATTVPVATRGIYLRHSFSLTDASEVSDMLLEIQYDDGFIAYINGERIEGANDPAVPDYLSTAVDDHPDATAINFTPFSLANGLPFLVDGENILAIHALNQGTGSSDLLITPRLTLELGGPQNTAEPVIPLQSGFLQTPTPGGPNTPGLAGDVLFSATSGLFSSQFDLTLTPSIAGETIRYTTDGSTPGSGSPEYTIPLTIDTTTEIRARSYAPDGGVGQVFGHTFVKMDPALTSWSSNLPVIVIDNDGQGNPLDKVFRTCFSATFEPDPSTGTTTLNSTPTLAERSAWHRRGSSSFTFSKPNYRLEIRDQSDEDKSVPLLGLPDESDWILSTFSRFDRALVRNPIAMETSKLVGPYAPRTKYVEVFFNQDGDNLEESDYFGVYILTENIKRDDNRINITRLDQQDDSGEEITGGYIFKSDRTDAGDYTFRTSRNIPSGGSGRFVSVEPPGPDLTSAQKAYLSGYVQEFEDALYGPGFVHPTTNLHYSEYIDVASFIDQHILEVYNKGPDSLVFSTYFHKDRGGKLMMGPIWDQERIMGVETDTATNRARNPENWNGDGSVVDRFHYDWWERFFQDPDFMQRWIDRWEELRIPVYNPSSFGQLFDAYEISLLGPSSLDSPITRNFTRWGSSGGNSGGEIWPNRRVATSTDPNSNGFYQFANPGITTGITDPATSPTAANILAYWNAEIDHVRTWNALRQAWIYDELPALPSFDTPSGPVVAGTSVSIVPPPGMSPGASIYYTINSTDPRAPGGAASIHAILWDGSPILVPQTQRLTVRILDPDNPNPRDQVLAQANEYDVWSAPVSALYEIGAPVADALVISELNYHPVDPSPAEQGAIPGVEADDFEFIEVMNIHPSDDINLTGAAFTTGITFTFGNLVLAPGDRAVVVRDTTAFAARYGANPAVVGEWNGGLSNSGEKITLVDGRGQIILTLDYRDGGLWDSTADGNGGTLVLNNPETSSREALGKSYNWSPSGTPGGSPGTADNGGIQVPGIVINEIIAHTDLPSIDGIELHNPTATAVDISGWFLSDSASLPLKYEIPPGTSIAPGAYMVFDEDDFNPTPLSPGPNDFALNAANGDDVYLVIADGTGTSVATYVDHVEFGATLNGESLGRWPNASGPLTPMSTPTFGEANSGPRIGPLIISEVNYHPEDPVAAALTIDATMMDDDLEFIELYNPGNSSVDLLNWRLRGEADFDFTSSIIVGADQTIVVVNFDPLLDANRANAFRAHYGIGAEIPLIGPFSGTINNSEGKVSLEQPDDPPPNEPGFIPHAVADALTYDDLMPWPESSDGGGPSLTRGPSETSSNDPSTWFSVNPSPGAHVPTLPGSAIPVEIFFGPGTNEITLSWPSVEGGLYEISESQDLENWEPFEMDYPSAGTSTSLTTPLKGSPRFYRLRERPSGF
ncbi:MAG: lamin tail domain-containing protein [Verrucomicrobiota bacterium]